MRPLIVEWLEGIVGEEAPQLVVVAHSSPPGTVRSRAIDDVATHPRGAGRASVEVGSVTYGYCLIRTHPETCEHFPNPRRIGFQYAYIRVLRAPNHIEEP